MYKITVSVPGKIHLLGEHSAVYGKPAILATVDKYCNISLHPRKDNKIVISSEQLSMSVTTTFSEVKKISQDAENTWLEFSKTNDTELLKSIIKNPLSYPCVVIGETFIHYKKSIQCGFDLVINSEIPMGAGLGSSAALAVSITAVVSSFLEEPFDKSVINNIAYSAEQKIHGYPSGGDNAAVCFGGFIWFRKEDPNFKIIQPLPFSIPDSFAKNFILIDTGKPVETTGEMVAGVRKLYQENPNKIQRFLNDQEELTRQLLTSIRNAQTHEVKQIIKQGESNLESIDVVSLFAKKIIRDIENSGGAAKICGGGGKTKSVGIILAFHQDLNILQKIINLYKLPSYSVRLGVEGIQII